MTTDDLVLLDRPRPDIAVVTLNRPDRLNALSFALVDQLHAALDEVQRDNAVRVVILTGAGRGFCSGLDLTSIEGSSTSAGTEGPRAGMLSQSHIAGLPQKLRRMQQPVIAAVNGAAYGGGFALALACDIRVAAPEAVFCSQFIKVGIGGCDIGISYTLPRMVGASKAFELLLTARKVDAEEAARLGLVAEVAGPERPVLDRAMELAETICGYAPFGVVMTKEVMWSNLDAPSFEAAIHLENRTQILAATGGEVMEAATAFMEKRPPNWAAPTPDGRT
jgi:enoyl-CoA hydratase/carnithine racemase